MDYPPFYKTRMGETFYCKTVPDLIRAIERLSSALERQPNNATTPVPSVRDDVD